MLYNKSTTIEKQQNGTIWKNLRGRSGKLWPFPVSMLAIGSNRGGPHFDASSSETIAMASKNIIISGIWAGDTFCEREHTPYMEWTKETTGKKQH